MGSAVGRVIAGAGHDVTWASDGRSKITRARASAARLRDVGALEALAGAEILFSIVPPHAAVEMATAAMQAGFRGLYVDANAIAPATAQQIAELVTNAGATYVDGSLIGPPPANRGDTRVYLSGASAGEVATIFKGTILDARVLTSGPLAASAIKMCFAGWTKGTAALLANIQELARAEDVYEALLTEWAESIPELPDRCARLDARAHEKAWRFIGEMEQIALAFAQRELPAGFHAAAAEVYRRISRRGGK